MGKLQGRASRRTALKNIVVGSGAMTALPLSGSRVSETVTPDQARNVRVRLDLNEELGPLNIDHYAVRGREEDSMMILPAEKSRKLDPKQQSFYTEKAYFFP